MIQIVTFSGKEPKYNNSDMQQFSLHDIRSLDEYEVTVIDLSDPEFWRNYADSQSSVTSTADIKSISEMIKRSERSKIVLVLPQNENFQYNYWKRNGKFNSFQELKNMLPNVTYYILGELYEPIADLELLYENTKTTVGNYSCCAAFYFAGSNNVLLKSQLSDKTTAMRLGRVTITTLKIKDALELICFLTETGLYRKYETAPEWMNNIQMFDDSKQMDRIAECKESIDELQNEIGQAQDILDSNARLKSILYTNGDELVDVVFEILEELLGCDLSEFEDEKKEDFLFELGEYVFLGEIKGVTPNVKNENVSQLEIHHQVYLDEHEDADPDKVKSLLIINHQRKKSIDSREPIKDTQIKLAKKYGSLIVETYGLLKILEQYRKSKLTRDEIIKMFSGNTGYLEIK